MGGRRPVNVTERRLDLMEVVARRAIATSDLHGLHGVELQARLSHTADMLIAELRSYVLTEAEQAEDTVLVDLPLKPRWIPAFLWRRIPTKRAQFQLAVERKVAYPYSTLALDHRSQLGRPVILREFGRTSW